MSSARTSAHVIIDSCSFGIVKVVAMVPIIIGAPSAMARLRSAVMFAVTVDSLKTIVGRKSVLVPLETLLVMSIFWRNCHGPSTTTCTP